MTLIGGNVVDVCIKCGETLREMRITGPAPPPRRTTTPEAGKAGQSRLWTRILHSDAWNWLADPVSRLCHWLDKPRRLRLREAKAIAEIEVSLMRWHPDDTDRMREDMREFYTTLWVRLLTPPRWWEREWWMNPEMRKSVVARFWRKEQ